MCSTVPVDQDIYILLVVMLSTCTVSTCRQCLHTCAPAAPAMLLLRTWCLQRIENRGSVQCTARARSRESIWTKPGQQAAAHPTTPSLSSGFSRENIVPSVARPFTWIRPWGSTMTLCTLCTLNSSAHCTLRKHNSTLHTGDGAQVLLSFGQSGSRRLCHSGSISS